MRSRICRALWSCGLICAIHLLLFGEANGSYFSGASPTLYYEGDELSVKVSEMTSRRTWIPVSYYAIPHCQPEKIMETGNLAGGLGGNGENSVYKFKMMEPERCHEVCRVKMDAKSAMEFKEKIEDGYRVNMDLDGLTLSIADPYDENSSSIYQQGFRIGVTGQYYGEEENSHFINNHLSFTIKYNRDIHLNFANIVRFEVKEFSVHHYESAWGAKTGLITCEVNENVLHLIRPQEVKETEEIIFTYSVKFEESDLKWASRWDGYVAPSDSSVHLFSVIWSFFMIALLFVKLGKLISGTLHLDTCRVSHLEPQGVTQEETRHTYVNNGALSSPSLPQFFCVCIGTGIQLFGVVLSTLISAALGFLAPSDRGCLMATMLLVWGFMGLLAGYTSARLHKLFRGQSHWMIIPLTTAITFPTIIFAIFSALSMLLHGEISVTVAKTFAFGFLYLIPPALIGGYIGSRRTAHENQATSDPSGQIPDQCWTKSQLTTLLVGIFPYVTVNTEIFYLVESIFVHHFYSSYGFLLMSFILLIVICAALSIIRCYNQLSNYNYYCGWHPFLVTGSSALYYLIHSVYIFFVELHIRKPQSLILFLGYILVTAPSFFLLTGTVGFFASFWFAMLLRSAVKTE